jgi:hypothetical protein
MKATKVGVICLLKVLEFCPHCNCPANEAHWFEKWSAPALFIVRILIPGIFIPFIFCTLHAKLRISEKMLKQVLQQCQSQGFCIIITNPATGKLKEAVLAIRKSGWKKFRAIAKKGTSIKIISFVSGARLDNLMMHDGVWEELLDLGTPSVTAARTSSAKNKANAESEAGNAEFKLKFRNALSSWRQIYKILPTATVEDLPTLEPLLKHFGDSYVACFGNLVTPYIHIVVCHTAELIRRHGTLGQYEQQGLENSINIHKASFFRSSSRGGGKNSTPVTTLMQVMNRFYRLRHFGQKFCPFLFKKSATKRKTKKWEPKPPAPIVDLSTLSKEQLIAAVDAQVNLDLAAALEIEDSLSSQSVSSEGNSAIYEISQSHLFFIDSGSSIVSETE